MEKYKDDKVILTKEEYQSLLDINEKLADAEKRANAANKAKSDFLSSMSHEIRTPMNTVLGMNELIRMTLADPDIMIGEKIGRVIGYSNGIQHSGEMLLYVINDILDISRIESGKLEIRPGEYRMHKLLDDMIPLFRASAEGKNLFFETEIDTGLPGHVEGDDVRVRQIVTNIVNNAVKYTREGKVCLKISGRVSGDTVIYDMSVSDTGIGIKQENLEHLFDAFERVDSEETHYIEGTGLGLTIVKNLLDLMGGSIEVDSVYGEGTVFTVHIPQRMLSDEKIKDYTPDIGLSSKENKHHYYRGCKVLVVDDNQTNIKVATSFLERMKAAPESALSGREALELIRQKHYDLIFIDHMMPELSGVKVIKKIKSDPGSYALNKDTPFVVMTANAVVGAKEKYINEYGFDGYIAKPFRFAELDDVMSTYIQGEEYAEEPASGKGPMRGGPGGPPPGARGEIWDIDFESGIEVCGNAGTYNAVAETYLDIQEENVRKLAEGMNSEDWESYRLVVHALKSSSMTIGAKNFSGFSMTVESATNEIIDGSDKEKNLGYLRGSYNSYMAAYSAVCENLRRHLASVKHA
ncbi:MAG: response regulator [Lachnospiraceae bacterium]|nr:response regulator [Lachnospiraceae bacterium]